MLLDQFGNTMPNGAGAAIANQARIEAAFGGSGLGGNTSFKSGGTGTQDVSCWNPRLQSEDRAILAEKDKIVARTRDLINNDGIFSGAVTEDLNVIIGRGLRFASKPDFRQLGFASDEAGRAWARDFAKKLEGLIKLWSDDVDKNCDAQGIQDFGGIQRTVRRERVVSGEWLALARNIKSTSSPFNLALQLVSADRLSNPDRKQNSQTLRAGVELNSLGRPVAYHIRNSHQVDVGNAFGGHGGNEQKWTRVPAYATSRKSNGTNITLNRRQVLHGFERRAPDQNRGLSLLAPILPRAKALHKYSEAELQTAQINALMAAFITSEHGPVSAFNSLGPNAGTNLAQSLAAYAQGQQAYHSQNHTNFNGSKLVHLYPGEKIEFSRSTGRLAGAYAVFEDSAMRNFASALGQSAAQFSRNYTKETYSSLRAGLLQAYLGFRNETDFIGRNFVLQVIDLLVQEAIILGLLPMPNGMGINDYFRFKGAFLAGRFIGPPRGWVDPVKEAQAAQIRIDMGISTQEQEAAQQGLDWEETFEQRAIEIQTAKELGIPQAQSALTPLEADKNNDGQIDDGEDLDQIDDTLTEEQKSQLLTRWTQ